MTDLATSVPKTSPCFPGKWDYLARMDWQQLASLGIVGMTAALLILSWLRRRSSKFSFQRDTHCGCSSPGYSHRQPSIVFRARKGERPQILVKQ
jgi:hypothetical protein